MSRVSGKAYSIYVLWSASSNRFYIGISDSPGVRVEQHNSDKHRGWTAKHRPWELVFVEEFPDYSAARRREIELKAQKGGAGFFARTGLDPAKFGRGS